MPKRTEGIMADIQIGTVFKNGDSYWVVTGFPSFRKHCVSARKEKIADGEPDIELDFHELTVIDGLDVEESAVEFGKAALEPVFKRGEDVVWKRTPDGRLLTNVVWRVVEHSPDGFEVGYAGSGCADFALNILAELFPIRFDTEIMGCFKGFVTKKAYELHQDFKFAFIAGIKNRNEGSIKWQDIEEWLGKVEDNVY